MEDEQARDEAIITCCHELVRSKELKVSFRQQRGHQSSWAGRDDWAYYNQRADVCATAADGSTRAGKAWGERRGRFATCVRASDGVRPCPNGDGSRHHQEPTREPSRWADLLEVLGERVGYRDAAGPELEGLELNTRPYCRGNPGKSCAPPWANPPPARFATLPTSSS